MSKPNPFFAEMTRRQRFYAFVGYGLLAAFLLTIGFAVAPKLHERFHADAGGPNHECAVTLIAVGKCEQGNVPVKVLVPRPPTLFFQAFLFSLMRFSPSFFARGFLSTRLLPLPNDWI